MKTLNQKLLALKIEYHWLCIGNLRKKLRRAENERFEKLGASERLHRYKAEQALIEYEVSLGLRDRNGIWGF